MPLTTGPDMCLPGLPQMNAPAKEKDDLLIANEGPSTPVKYDKHMDTFVPYMGVGRPGKIRLKKPPEGMKDYQV